MPGDVFAWTHWYKLSFPPLPSIFHHLWVSALQLWGDSYQCDKHVPSTAQEGKEKESGAATSHPSKRYENRGAEVFQILSTTTERQQSKRSQDSCTPPLTLPGRWPVLAPIGGGRNGSCLLLGPGSHLPAALAVKKLLTKPRQEVSAPTNQRREEPLKQYSPCSNRRLKPGKMKLHVGDRLTEATTLHSQNCRCTWEVEQAEQIKISLWGTSLLKRICYCFQGQACKLLVILSKCYCQCWATGREEGKDWEVCCVLDDMYLPWLLYANSMFCISDSLILWIFLIHKPYVSL